MYLYIASHKPTVSFTGSQSNSTTRHFQIYCRNMAGTQRVKTKYNSDEECFDLAP